MCVRATQLSIHSHRLKGRAKIVHGVARAISTCFAASAKQIADFFVAFFVSLARSRSDRSLFTDMTMIIA